MGFATKTFTDTIMIGVLDTANLDIYARDCFTLRMETIPEMYQ